MEKWGSDIPRVESEKETERHSARQAAPLEKDAGQVNT